MKKMIYKDHSYALGKKYAAHTPSSKEEYLQAAKNTVKFLDTLAYETEEGIYWEATVMDDAASKVYKPGQRPEEELDFGLFSGSIGIAYFLLKLYEIDGNKEYLDKAKRGMDYLCTHWKALLTYNHVSIPDAKYGYYYGVAGAGSMLLEFYKILNIEIYRNTVEEMIAYLDEVKIRSFDGIYWTKGSGMALDAGTVLFLIEAAQVLKHERASDLACQGGKYLLTYKLQKKEGITYETYPLLGFDAPNFAYGSSGTGYVLARLYQHTKEEIFLEAAENIADYLINISVPQKAGRLIPYRLDMDPYIYYQNVCHGPGGNSRFFYLMYEITGDSRYNDFIFDMYQAIVANGIPDRQMVGYWNNISYCCGTAGLLYYFIQLFSISPKEELKELAEKCGNIILGEMEEKGGMAYWPIAFARIAPTEMAIKAGFFDGAAGIATALLQLYKFEDPDFNWTRLPDDPFPSRPVH